MTFLAGKDREIEQTIDLFTKELTELGLDLEFTTKLNPGINLYSCELVDRNNPSLIHTNGKGISEKASIASALGEMAERLLNQSFFDSYYMGNASDDLPFNRYHDEIWVKYPDSYMDKNNRLRLDKMEVFSSRRKKEVSDFFLKNNLFSKKLIDEIGWMALRPLTDYATSDTQKGICAVPMTNEHFPDEKAYFPLRYLESCFCTNGMCAGNTPEEAKVQGLSEIYERFVRRFLFGYIPESYSKTLANTNIRALPVIPEEFISRKYPEITETLNEFSKHNIRVTCYDASLGGVFPVVAVCAQPVNSVKYKISIGAHPNMKIALERTLTELMQGVEWNNLDYVNFSLKPYINHDFTDNSRKYSDSVLKYKSSDTYQEEDCTGSEDEYANDGDEQDCSEQASDGKTLTWNNQEEMFSSLSALAGEDISEQAEQEEYHFRDSLNFIGNFIDGSGEVHPSFFTHESKFKFTDWSLDNGTTEEEYKYLLNIARKLDKKVWCYDASYKDLYAYRLIIPNLSEVYIFDGRENEDELNDPSIARSFKQLSPDDLSLPDYPDADTAGKLSDVLHLVENGNQYAGLNLYSLESMIDLYNLVHENIEECEDDTQEDPGQLIYDKAIDLAEHFMNSPYVNESSLLYSVCLIMHLRLFLEDEKGYSNKNATRFIKIFCDNATQQLADRVISADTQTELMNLIRLDIERNPKHDNLIKTFRKLIKIQTKLHKNL
ncbi:YcaO-like family protein [Ruminobacter sp. RM87]|uniref:YcaO-like family protein n=1 Tax=Ruminobacter sp. RM87 TaxID=1200567 RepID=UPI0004E0DA11|nr:YcaO-like family protein [Ruminobacter sp. RM87]